MSRAAVRDALQTFLTAPAIPGLHLVFRAPPRWVDGKEWQLNASLGSGAVAALHIAEDSDQRITVPAPNVLLPGNAVGQQMVTYKVGLMVFYQYLVPSGGLAAAGEDAWVETLDTILTGIKTRLRSDPNAGNPAVIWQCAQNENGIRIQSDIPRQTEGGVVTWNVVEFDVDTVENG